ncbi:hypothetical protein H2203_000913 [Taxawa tesnikishii (nom. ined.)]|nr:hypothetical protein H2203_000913 [Dothideales sp. JES 119]
MSDAGRVRLHITPFTPALSKSIIPPLCNQSRPAYHRGFGFVDLPKAEADKLRKKLNGTVFKGTKMRIDEARPEKRKAGTDTTEDAPDKPRKRAKKEKRKDGVLPGFELPKDRQVKRGWTEPNATKKGREKQHKSDDKKDKHKREPSKYTKEKELLFKTKVAHKASAKEPAKPETGKEKKNKKKGVAKGPVVIHEFEQTKKYPTFLREEASVRNGGIATYVEGTGWVDEDGTVVEAVKPRRMPMPKAPATAVSQISPQSEESASETEDEADQDAAVGTEDDVGKKLGKKNVPKEDSVSKDVDGMSKQELGYLSGVKTAPSKSAKVSKSGPESAHAQAYTKLHAGREDAKEDVSMDDEASSSSDEASVEESAESASDSNSDSESSSEESSSGESDSEESVSTAQGDVKDTTDVEQGKPQETVSADSKASTSQNEVHPLEALFRRPNPDSDGPPKLAPINTSFSFFGQDEDAEDDEVADLAVPQTPFTQRDIRQRGMRSAAPTPDTAHFSRKISFPFGGDDEEEEVEEEEDATQVVAESRETAPVAKEVAAESRPESEFAEWFFKNRGDNNRAWKKRRREALKQNRQRENRRLSRRIV